jgi:hypothetical protein
LGERNRDNRIDCECCSPRIVGEPLVSHSKGTGRARPHIARVAITARPDPPCVPVGHRAASFKLFGQ